MRQSEDCCKRDISLASLIVATTCERRMFVGTQGKHRKLIIAWDFVSTTAIRFIWMHLDVRQKPDYLRQRLESILSTKNYFIICSIISKIVIPYFCIHWALVDFNLGNQSGKLRLCSSS